jgi:hypothetical protein
MLLFFIPGDVIRPDIWVTPTRTLRPTMKPNEGSKIVVEKCFVGFMGDQKIIRVVSAFMTRLYCRSSGCSCRSDPVPVLRPECSLPFSCICKMFVDVFIILNNFSCQIKMLGRCSTARQPRPRANDHGRSGMRASRA